MTDVDREKNDVNDKNHHKHSNEGTVPSPWIHLQDKKSFSRLLYPNPVSFLTTRTNVSTINPDTKPKRNVMVVSWLTAINNSGRFVMSINKSRHTANILISENEFVLSVPVAGMEDLVLNVGKASGRWGVSKFPRDHECKNWTRDRDGGLDPDVLTGDPKAESQAETQVSSNSSPKGRAQTQLPRKKKKRFENGIEGLVAVKLGTAEEAGLNDDEPFAIQGCIAHLMCIICGVVGSGGDGTGDGNGNCAASASALAPASASVSTTFLDDEHHLIVAEVTSAYVCRDYWNEGKKLFQPQSNIPPFMTFFGSQTFGYVLRGGNEDE